MLRHSLTMVASLSVFSLVACGDSSSDGGGGAGGSDIEAPASCSILAGVVGSYTVTGEATGNEQREPSTAQHQRGTITVGADYSIDFDTALGFGPLDITTCYDRLQQDVDRRIQVSYGADDDGPVINLYMASGSVVDEIQYRHRDQGVNIRVLVQKD